MSTANHAALMDGVYRRQRHFYDLTRKYYLLGRDRLIDEMQIPAGARVVEIGCGTARNLIRLAKRFPTAQLYGLDASVEMLKTAAVAIERAGLTSRIVLRHGYAEQLSPAMFALNAPFDVAFFSYSLSMIPDWRQALEAARGALGPEGQIHVADFADLGGTGRLRALLHAWLRLFHVAPREELLRELEKCGARLQFLPGRYAFLLRARASELTAVAHAPQAAA